MTLMRAKMKVENLLKYFDSDENVTQLDLWLRAVCKDGSYPADGCDEDNTFARFTPNAELKMSIMNPNLFDSFEIGQKFYVDFTRVP